MRKIASAKVRSLLSEGYKIVVDATSFGFITLKHEKNSHKARVTLGKNGVFTYINDKISSIEYVQ